MAGPILADRILENSITELTGPFALTAIGDPSYRRFRDVMSVGDWTWGKIVHPGNGFVSGRMDYTATDQMTMTEVKESTNSNLAVSFLAGIKEVSIDLPAFYANALHKTGDLKLTWQITADPGWLIVNDGSIGNISSGGTTRANDDTEDLWILCYDNMPALVVQDSSGSTVARGASAAADYAANRRLVIPKALGRSAAIAGAGAGLTTRTIGSVVGAETHALTVSELPSLVMTGFQTPTIVQSGTGATVVGNITNDTSITGIGPDHTIPGGTAHDIMNPNFYANLMVKL